MKKTIIMLALFAASSVTYGQVKGPGQPIPAKTQQSAPAKDTLFFDDSFEDAGTDAENKIEYTLKPKYYKPGDVAPEQPIALSKAKKEAVALARAKPTLLRRDCLNLIYTVDPIYTDGSITGAIKGTIVIRWESARRQWVFKYLKYQIINIDVPASVFMYEAK